MQSNIEPFSIFHKFKLVVFLTDENDLRIVNLAKYFANSIKVLYITSKNINKASLDYPNIDIHNFNSFFNSGPGLIYEYYCYKLIKKICSICKKDNIFDSEVLFVLNCFEYAPVLDAFPQSMVHLDYSKAFEEHKIDKNFKKVFLPRINSVTTSNMEIKKQLETYFNAVFRIPDGVEDKLFSNKKESLSPWSYKYPLIGCFCSDPYLLDYDFIELLAENFSSYNFLFLSQEKFRENNLKADNLNFLTTHNLSVKYDLILLPLKNDCPEMTNKVFYQNLMFSAPILALDNQELKLHKNIINLCRTKEDILIALEELTYFKNFYRLEKNLLKENCSWNVRLKQIEGIILAHL